MCDQTEVAYLPNDIVWVKLSNVWWPGEVQDENNLEEDITSGLKKKPLAIVKFFDEDSYEFPKNLNQIYHYNCLRKDEFIKKGLDMCRAETNRDLPYAMKKFPRDVEVAEVKTGGNPKYIYDPKFEPEEKFDYREHFGMKPLKKVKPERDSSSPLPQTYKAKPLTPKVTFYDLSNRSGSSRIRTPTEKMLSNAVRRSPNGTPLSILKTSVKYMRNKLPALTSFPCLFCDFSAKSANGVIMHYKSHYRGETLPLPPCVPNHYLSQYNKNQQKAVRKENGRASVTVVSDKPQMKRKRLAEETETPKKLKNETPKIVKRKSLTTGNASISKASGVEEAAAKPVTQKRRVKRTRSEVESEALEILKDWDDFSEEESDDIPPKDEKKVDLPIETEENKSILNDETPLSPAPHDGSPLSSPATSPPIKTLQKSCFDFDENDEALNLDPSLKFGQKLPRVINEKQPSSRRSRQVKTEEDNLKNDVDSFLETVQIPTLPQVPETTLAASDTKKGDDILETSKDKDVTDNNASEEENKTVSSLPVESASTDLNMQDPVEKKNKKRKTLSTDHNDDGESLSSSEDSVSSPSSEEKKKIKIDKSLDSCSNNNSSITSSKITGGEQLSEKQMTDLKILDTHTVTDNPLAQQSVSEGKKKTSNESIVETSHRQLDKEILKINISEISEFNSLKKTKIGVDKEVGRQTTNKRADSLVIDETESTEDESYCDTDFNAKDFVGNMITDFINNTVTSNDKVNTVTETQQTESSNFTISKDVTQKDICTAKLEENDGSNVSTEVVESFNKITEQEKNLIDFYSTDKGSNNKMIELKKELEKPVSEIFEESIIGDNLNNLNKDIIIEGEVSSKVKSELVMADREKIILQHNLIKENVSSSVENEIEMKRKNTITKEEIYPKVKNEIELVDCEKIKVEHDFEVTSNVDMAKCEKTVADKNLIKKEIASKIECEMKVAECKKIIAEKKLIKEEVSKIESGMLQTENEKIKILINEEDSKIECDTKLADCKKIVTENNLMKNKVASIQEREVEKTENHLIKEEVFDKIECEIEKAEHKKTITEKHSKEVASVQECEVEKAEECKKSIAENNLITEEVVASKIEFEMEKADNGKIKIENNIINEEVASNIENELEKADREKIKSEKNLAKKEVTLEEALRDCTKKKVKIAKKEKMTKKEITSHNTSSTSLTMQDISLFDINSMPIIIQSENENLSEMEICCGPGPFVPDPDADVITVYLRKKGEELPEDFEPGKELITVKPPPPDFVPCHNMKRIPFPEGKPISSNAAQPTPSTSSSDKENKPTTSSSTSTNKENAAAGSSNEVAVKPSTSSNSSTAKVTTTRKSNLVTSTVSQQKQILRIPHSTSGKFIISSSQGTIVSSATSNTVTGSRSLKTQLLTAKVQKKTVPKQIVINTGGAGSNLTSTSSKVTLGPAHCTQIKPTPSIGPSIVQVMSQQGIIPVMAGKNSTVTTGIQTVVQTEMKPPTIMPRVSPRSNTTSNKGQVKPVASSSIVTSSSSQPERKHSLKIKQPSPNILQKSPKKPLRQVKPQIVSVPKPSQSSDIVSSIVQSDATAESVLFLAVEDGSSVIPLTSCDQDSNSLIDTTLVNINSPSTSQGLDNIFLSIDGTSNFVKITNQGSSSISQKSQDILAEALANTQVLQTESGELCEMDGTTIVTQEYPAPSLTNNVLETSLTYNTAPIMSTVEVPSSVAAGSQPSMPLLTDDIELKPQTVYINSPATYQYIDVSGTNISATSDPQIVFTTSILSPGNGKITSTENLLQREENVLPEFLKCDLSSKRPENSKNAASQQGDT